MELTKRDFGVSFLKKIRIFGGTSLPSRKKIPAPRKGLELIVFENSQRGAPLASPEGKLDFLAIGTSEPTGKKD